MTFDAQNKGLALSNASQIRAVHNSFARQTLFELDNKRAAKEEDVFHFIGYVPIDGRLYELDGLKEGPIDLGAIPPNSDWVDVVRPIIQKRIDKYSEGEIHFNLMAIVSDRQLIYQRRIDEILSGTGDSDMDTDTKQVEVARLRSLIEDDMAKKKRYKVQTKYIVVASAPNGNDLALISIVLLFSSRFRLKIFDANTTICLSLWNC